MLKKMYFLGNYNSQCFFSFFIITEMDRTVMYFKENCIQTSELFALLKSGRVEANFY